MRFELAISSFAVTHTNHKARRKFVVVISFRIECIYLFNK